MAGAKEDYERHAAHLAAGALQNIEDQLERLCILRLLDHQRLIVAGILLHVARLAQSHVAEAASAGTDVSAAIIPRSQPNDPMPPSPL